MVTLQNGCVANEKYVVRYIVEEGEKSKTVHKTN